MNFKKISAREMKHSSRGIFRYEQRKPVEFLKGGHGEENIKYLIKNNLPFSIDSEYSNGVRSGHIPCHIRKRERETNGHFWFPRKWSKRKIEKAGIHVANLQKNQKIEDHTPMNGSFKGIEVVVYKSNGRICGICPKFLKGVKVKK
jgi:hypothetical protein